MALPRALPGQDLARRHAHRVPHEQLVGRGAAQLSRRPEPADLDRRSQDLRSRLAAVDRFEGHRSGLGRRHGLLPLRSRRRRERLGVRREGEEARAGHEVHRLRREDDRRRRRRRSCSSRPATSTSSIRSPAATQVVNITATGDFPWMMPRWEDVTEPDDEHRALADRQARRRRSARRDLHDPGREGRRPQPDAIRAARPSAIRRGRPTASTSRTSATSPASTSWCIEAQDGLTPPREIALPKPTHYYTPSWSPDSKKLLYTDTNLNVWVLDVATGQAKVVGNDPWMVPQRTLNPDVEPRLEVGRVRRAACNSLYHAIFVSNVETGETKQITDGLADAMWPAWDASGKYLWFLASTDFGLRSQWLDMTSYDRDGDVRAVLRGPEEGRADPAAAGERRGHRRRQAPARRRRRRRPRRPRRRAGGASRADAARQAAGAARGRATPVTVQIDFDGLQQRIISVPGVPERAVLAAARRRRRARSSTSSRGGGGARRWRRQHAASLSAERSPRGAVRDRRRRVRRQRRRPQAALSRRRWRRRTRRRRRRRAGAGAGAVPRRRRSQRRRRPGSGRLNVDAAHVSRAAAKSSSRSSTKAGATSATTSTCRTCTAPTGRR